MPSKNKAGSRLLSVHIFRDKTAAPLNTTLTAAAAKGALSLTVASIANGADGDAIRIGSGNDMELNKISGAPAGNTVTLAWPLQRAHIIGEEVKEMVGYDHGAPDQDGVDAVIGAEISDVMVATQRLPLTNVKGWFSFGAEWKYPFLDLNTLVTSVGALLTRITGSGTVAAPKQFITDGNDFGEENNLAVILGFVLVDGTFLFVELWGATMDYTAVGRIDITRGQAPRISMRARASAGGVMYTAAPGYTIDVSKRAQKHQVFRSLSEVGFRQDAGGGVNSTLSAAAAAGAQILSVVSAVNAAAGDRVRVGSGSEAEYHVIDSVNVNDLNLRTKLLRRHEIGEAVVEQQNVVLTGVVEQGVSVDLGGDVRVVRSATTPLEAGIIPGNAMIAMALALFDITLANNAYALGIPQASISGGRLPLDADLGSSDIGALYFKLLLQNGDIVEIDGWGLAQQLQEYRLKMANQGVTALPISGRPATFQVLQYQ